LCSKYGGDAKFLRVHKRLKLRCPSVAESDASLFRILIDIKSKTDEKLLQNSHLVENEAYFTGEIQRIAVTALRTNGVTINEQDVNCLKKCISREYFAEREMAVI
jgi:type I restriction enzyme R subunit